MLIHFKQLFFNRFNAFKVLKFVHFTRDNYYPDSSVFIEAYKLLEQKNKPIYHQKDLLTVFREIDLSR